MATFTTSNPVTIGNPTKKADYDKVFDNTRHLRDDALTFAGVKTYSSHIVLPLPTSTAGSPNAQLLASTGFALAAGNVVTFIAYATNTAAMTLNVNSTGAKNVKVWAGPTTPATTSYAGMILAGGTYTVLYDGTQFILLNPSALLGVNDNSSAGAGVVGEVNTQSWSSTTMLGSSGVAANFTSLSLTAGDWDIGLNSDVIINANTSLVAVGLSTTSATFQGLDGQKYGVIKLSLVSGDELPIVVPPFQLSLASTTTVYVVTKWTGSGAPNLVGMVTARRVR